MFEFTCAHDDPVKAADDALRAKGYLRSLCDEYGLVPDVHAGAPHAQRRLPQRRAPQHQRVARRAQRVWDPETRDCRQLARNFAAGMMVTMPDTHLTMRPWVNSHRRMDRLSWAPEDTSWGPDNHAVALRVIYGSMPDQMARIEHRAPRPGREPVPVAGGDVRGRPEGHPRGARRRRPTRSATRSRTTTSRGCRRRSRRRVEAWKGSAFARSSCSASSSSTTSRTSTPRRPPSSPRGRRSTASIRRSTRRSRSGSTSSTSPGHDGDPDRAAFDRLCSSEPVLTDIRPAGDVVPGFDARPDPHLGRADALGAVRGRPARGDPRRGAVRAPRRHPRGGGGASWPPARSGSLPATLRLRRLGGRCLHRLDARVRGREPAVRQRRVLQLLRGGRAAPAQLRVLGRRGPRRSSSTSTSTSRRSSPRRSAAAAASS